MFALSLCLSQLAFAQTTASNTPNQEQGAAVSQPIPETTLAAEPMPLKSTATEQALNKNYQPASDANSRLNSDYVLKLVGGMLLIIFILFLLLGLLKKAGFNPSKKLNGFYSVLSVHSLGPKEKICLVEIGDTWLVLGITPHHISALHTLPKDSIDFTGNHKIQSETFAKMLEKFKKPSG